MNEKSLRIVIFLFFILINTSKAYGLSMSLSLSKSEVVKNHNFNGAYITLTGKMRIKADNIVVNVLGPKAQYIVWQKEKKFGIWTNSKSFLTQYLPSYQFISTSYDDDKFLSFTKKVNNIMRYSYPKVINRARYDKNETKSAAAAFRDVQREEKMFDIKAEGFKIEDSKFVTKIPIPVNAPEGTYAIKVYALKNFKLVGRRTIYFTIDKDEKYQKLKHLSREYVIPYTILSIITTMLVGFVANLIFRKAKKFW